MRGILVSAVILVDYVKKPAEIFIQPLTRNVAERDFNPRPLYF